MKKSLILLPLAALLLTGCGDSEEKFEPLDNNIPSGGKEVDVEKEDEKNDLINKLAGNLKISYDALKTGVSLETVYNLKELSVVDDETKFKATDLGFTFKVTAAGLDKTINEWQIAAEMKDFKGKVVVDENKVFEASNINLGVYLDKGNLYVDLANANLVKLANEIADFAFPQAKSYIQLFAKKLKIENIFSLIGVSINEKLPELKDKDIEELKTEMKAEFGEIKDFIKFFDYEENELAALLTYGEDHETLSQKDSMHITGNFVFNKKGEFAKVYLTETIDNFVKEDGKIVESVKASMEEGVVATFGISEVSMPDFSSYEAFPIQMIMQLVGQAVSSLPITPAVPLPEPIVQPVEE